MFLWWDIGKDYANQSVRLMSQAECFLFIQVVEYLVCQAHRYMELELQLMHFKSSYLPLQHYWDDDRKLQQAWIVFHLSLSFNETVHGISINALRPRNWIRKIILMQTFSHWKKLSIISFIFQVPLMRTRLENIYLSPANPIGLENAFKSFSI